MVQQRAEPSSCSFTQKWMYDVFLSFRGKDTRHSFTCNLYKFLCEKGIHTFMDDEGLRRGEEITPALLNAIENSRIAVIVFSENYASSTFCLDELVKILECLKEEQGRSVFPIFYDVDPSQVRYQKRTYSEALAKHQERFQDDHDKVKKWRKALNEAANLSGWHFQHGSQPEYEFIKKIVDEICEKVNFIPLHVADKPIGLEYAVQAVKYRLELESDDVNMIGIYGIGGIGKTTIARAVCNSICSRFEGMCFLSDIREKAVNKHGLVKLQEKMLSEILKEKDFRVGDVNRGIPIIKRRLGQKKVLLVLDDVDKLEQLQVLAREHDWCFGSGSRIIITTRDRHLLATHGVRKFYEVEPLNVEKALGLFNWHAFKNNKADPKYVNISNRAISYARGLPLALEVIGSHLFGKSLNECNSALDKYERIPHEKIHEILKVSYDGLEENEKGIFLDIACFFINTDEVEYVTRMLRARGFYPEDGLRVLVDRSLIQTDVFGFVRMHDLIRDMGREIVRQESILEPGRRSRLWFDKDIVHVLEENTGTDKIEFIKLECNNIVQWNGKAFKKMKNLRILIIENATFSMCPKHLPNSLSVLSWSCYPSSSLPGDFNPKRLEILHMPESYLQIFQPNKMFESLSTIIFEDCEFLTDIPSLREVPFLTELVLDNCTNLVKIDDSIGFLEKLCYLRANGCTKLKTLAPCIMLTSLEILNLAGCSCLESFPEVLGKMEKIRELYLDNTAIDKLPFSIRYFVGLELLSLMQCKRLNQLPSIIRILPKVEVLIDYRTKRRRFFEENCQYEELSSKVSPKAVLVCHHPRVAYLGSDDPDFTYLDVYYSYTNPKNAVQVCPPNPLMHGYFDLLFQKLAPGADQDYWYSEFSTWSTHFSFRNKFPKIAMCCSELAVKTHPTVFIFELSILINGTKQFSSSCNYIFFTGNPVLWCDLQCKAEEIFSEHEWNEAEILFEIKCSTWPYRITEGLGQGENIHWCLIGVYEEGNMDDIEFKQPMSTFTFFNGEILSPLPSCLHYNIRYWSKEGRIHAGSSRQKLLYRT